MFRVSTKIKVASGYILLFLLLIFSIHYIYHKMQLLTKTNVYEEMLAKQRRMTNQLIVNLYQSEVLMQAFGMGQLDLYENYNTSMQNVVQGIDSLRSIIKDKNQLSRLDSISLLLNMKKENTASLIETLRDNSADKIYQRYIKQLAKKQKTINYKQPVAKTMVTHSNVYTIRKKSKSIFKRIADIFHSGKGDTTKVERITQEVKTDTVKKSYNPSHAVVRILQNVQSDVSNSRQKSLENVRTKIDLLRNNSMMLSQQINKILLSIDNKEQQMLEYQSDKENLIRQHAAVTITIISVVALLLAMIFLFIIWRDITRSNHYRRELEKSNRYAENLLVAREKLMLTITHDIKAPAGSILGYLELLSRIVSDGRQKFYLNNMKDSAHHLLDLVKSLLDFYRLEANKMDVNNVSFSPKELFDEIYLGFKPLAENKQLALDYTFDIETENKQYIGDPFRIRQIVENLISNSIKFTKQGSVKLEVSVHPAELKVRVIDTGCGISKEDQHRIFEEFTRLKSAQGENGFGLGLAIVMKLVELLNGHIQLESDTDKGSCFTVTLPIAPSTAEEGKQAVSAEDNIPLTSVPCKVLLIDDDPIQMQLTSSMLEHLQVKSECCDKPDDVIRTLENGSFNLVFTDLQMPAMDGFELMNLIGQTDTVNQLPVVAITARSDMDKAFLQSKGFAGCLHKPFSLSELAQIIRETIQCDVNATSNEQPSTNDINLQYNFQALTAFSGDDAEEAVHIMETFVSEMEKDKAKIEKALDDNDRITVSQISHKLIPRFKMLGEKQALPHLLILEKQSVVSTLSQEETEKVSIVLGKMQDMMIKAKEYIDRLVKRS